MKKSWYAQNNNREKGRQKLYANSTIICALTLKVVFYLPLRATQGFLDSLLILMQLPALQAPDYTTLSRRKNGLQVMLPHKKKRGDRDIVLDSTGLKVYGEGEWKVRQYGYTKRRTWRKLHLVINPATHMIEAVELTTNAIKDNQVFEIMLDQVHTQIKSVSGDGAYDTKNCYEVIEQRGAKANIPPRQNARLSQTSDTGNARDDNINTIRDVGRKRWKQQSGYHQRSLAETAMFRFKKIFGGALASRKLSNQDVFSGHASIYCLIEVGIKTFP